ncbi:hypothetical protein [Acidisoma cladoniae]|jgi:hypothetical protein|uniref:hypothetical protein n=1 Tax=Acidisoma cladoniae TaxID=3040935 RepID=UPI00254A925B|nr:hypothetical protein [Acidisoma sp. PAMC 29798]
MASELPYTVILIQALGPTVVAIAVAAFTIWIAFRQVKIARQQAEMVREKLKHDLYDRRYAIYLTFEKMLRVSLGEKELGEKEAVIRDANIAAHQSLFLFGSEMKAYLLELNSVAWRRLSKRELIEVMKDLPPEAKIQHAKEHSEDTKRIMNEADVLAARFLPYLKLDDYRDVKNYGSKR